MALGSSVAGKPKTAGVVAIWEYDSRDAYERINSAVVADPASHDAQRHRATLGPLFTEREEVFMLAVPPL